MGDSCDSGGFPRSGSPLPLIGLVRERKALMAAIRRRKSCLLLGPAGSGKSRLLQSVLDSDAVPDWCAVIPPFETPHQLLVLLARELIRKRHKALLSAAAVSGDWERWLRGQTSVRLRGLLWEALEAEPGTLILDGVQNAGHSTYRFLQRVYFTPGMSVIAVARRHSDLGALAKLFWDPREVIQIGPLSEAEACRLFDAAAVHYDLRLSNFDDFRRRVLESARGHPGEIIAMCRLAADPRYVSRGCAKFTLIRIEMLMGL